MTLNLPTDEVFLTTEEVLEYLQVNLRTVYRLIKAGKIPVGPPLVEHLLAYCPELGGHLRQLEGTGSFQGRFDYHPGAAAPTCERRR